MDFVVVGLGIGAFAVLLGLAVRDLGPMFRRIPRDGSMPWAEVAERVAWGRRCRAAGLVVAIAGAALCLITGVALLVRVSDPTGMWTVLVALALLAIGIGIWAIRYQTVGQVPSVSLLAETPGENPPAQRPVRRSALAGIKGSRPNLGRRSAGIEAVFPAGDRGDEPQHLDHRTAVDAGEPLSPLTVDASGAMRRTPIGVPPDPAAPAPNAVRATQSDAPDPPRSQRGQSPSRDPRNRSQRGQGTDSFRG